MAPINSYSGLRSRLEPDPAKKAAYAAEEKAAFADIDRHIANWEARAARMAGMGRNPGLEMAARRAAAGTYGPATKGITLSGPGNGSSNSLREAAAYAESSPGLRTGSDVFGRNDREAAMQRNRDFIRSGRGSMFGPRPATTKGQNAEALRGLKRYEAETARRTNAAAAQNHRYELEQLAGLRRRELGLTERNNAAMAQNDRLKIAQNAATKYHSNLAKVLADANLAPEVQASILEKMGGAAGARPGGFGPGGLGENRPYIQEQGQPVNRGMEQQPAAPSYKYQERPRGGLGDKDVQGYLEERGIVPQAWWNEEQKPAQQNPQEVSPAAAVAAARQPDGYEFPDFDAPLEAAPTTAQAPALKTGSRLRAAKQRPLPDQYRQGIGNLLQRGENPDDYIPVMGDFGGIQFVRRDSDLSSRNTYRKLTDRELAALGLDASIYPSVKPATDLSMTDHRYYGYH